MSESLRHEATRPQAATSATADGPRDAQPPATMPLWQALLARWTAAEIRILRASVRD